MADEPQRIFEIPGNRDPRISLGTKPADNGWENFLRPEVVGSELLWKVLVGHSRAGLLLIFPGIFHLDKSLEFIVAVNGNL